MVNSELAEKFQVRNSDHLTRPKQTKYTLCNDVMQIVESPYTLWLLEYSEYSQIYIMGHMISWKRFRGRQFVFYQDQMLALIGSRLSKTHIKV